MKPTFYQRAKEVLTRPITIKGAAALASRIFKRRAMQEDIIRTPQSAPSESSPPQSARGQTQNQRRSVDSGLWEEKAVGIRSRSVVEKADGLRAKGLELIAEGHEEYADSFNMEAAELYIQAGILSKAEAIGLEFQNRGRYMTAAKILSESGARPFFELLEYLHKNNLPKMAKMILQNFTGPRGVVKYQEMYKPFPADLVHAFSGKELVIYSKKMMLQRKKHHVFQLAELTDKAGMYSESAELYGLLGMHRSQAIMVSKALVKEGRYLEAGRHCVSYNLAVEARDIAVDAATSGELLQAGMLFLELGEKRTARALAARASKEDHPEAVELFNLGLDAEEIRLLQMHPKLAESSINDGQASLFSALDHMVKGDSEMARAYAHRADIVESALLLYERGRFKESYQIAQGMKMLGNSLGSEFCRSAAARIYSQGATMIMRQQSNVIPLSRLRAA